MGGIGRGRTGLPVLRAEALHTAQAWEGKAGRSSGLLICSRLLQAPFGSGDVVLAEQLFEAHHPGFQRPLQHVQSAHLLEAALDIAANDELLDGTLRVHGGGKVGHGSGGMMLLRAE